MAMWIYSTSACSRQLQRPELPARRRDTSPTSHVYWSVRGEWNGGSDLTDIPVGTTKPLTWYTSVRVTGDNQGLGGWVISVGVQNLTTGRWVSVGLPSPSWQKVYMAGGATGAGPSTIPGRSADPG